jgi:hypothetical protein
MTIYTLQPNDTHMLPGRNLDVWLADGENVKSLRFRGCKGVVYPSYIAVEVERALDGVSDLPFCERSLPMFSRRLLDRLLEVGPIRHVWVPARVSLRGNPDLRMSSDYGFVDVAAISGAIDLEKSELRTMSMFPDKIASVDRLVLTQEVDLPPLFRLEEWGQLLLTELAFRHVFGAEIAGVECRNLSELSQVGLVVT